MLSTFKKVLVFAAHPDDEIIGCAGTIKKLSDLGAEISVVIATGGDTGISEGFVDIEDLPDMRKNESLKTKEILGISRLFFLNHKTQQLKNDQQTFHQFIRMIRQEKPDLVMFHYNRDKHRDHKILSEICKEAIWKSWENIMPDLGTRHRVKEAWYYEVIDPISEPDIVVNIDKYLQVKIDSLALHVSQKEILEGIQNYIKGLSMVRAYSIGCEFAEAFKICNILPRTG